MDHGSLKKTSLESGRSSIIFDGTRRDSGDHCAMEPPVPIPNTEVKRRSADGSVELVYARVGRCQYFPPLHPVYRREGGFFVPTDARKSAHL